MNRDAGIVAIPGGYDGRGNQLTDGYRNFGFDIDNQLVVGGAGQTTVGVAYDPLGRLRATQTNSGVWTWFLYAGDKLVAEFADRNDQTPLRSYAHGPGVDEPFEWYEHSGGSVARTWFYGDRQGSIIATVNYNTFASTPYRYGPYGEPAEGWGLPRFRYTGQATLPEAQVYYYKARVYDPMLGRFLQTDPIDQEDDPNLYAYVGEDPTNRTDPSGACAQPNRTNSPIDGCIVTGHNEGRDNPKIANINPQDSGAVNQHAQKGDGSPREANFNRVSLNDLGGSLQKFARQPGSLRNAIAKAAETGKPVPITILGLKAGGQIGGKTPIGQQGGIGRFAVTLSGTVTANERRWSMNATARGVHDMQDYLVSNRNPVGEALTAYGRRQQEKGGGEDYDITFFGSQDVHIEGSR